MFHRVLIVDDSSITRLLVRRTLPLTGIEFDEIHEAASGAQALDVLRAQQIDLVLTDLNMPEMDGSALIRAMDESPQLCHVPVVILSTEGSKPRLEQIKRPLVAGYLRKPFTPEQLKATLANLTVQS